MSVKKFTTRHSYDPPLRITEIQALLPGRDADNKTRSSLRLNLPHPPNGDDLDEAFFYVLDSGRVVGYFNRCTHVSIPMDFDDGEFLDTMGFVMCKVHGARYDLETGEACMGPGRGSLTKINCKLENEELVIYGWERHY